MKQELTVQIHLENGSYWAQVVEYPGCFATGDTLDELAESLRESLSLVLGREVGGVDLDEEPENPTVRERQLVFQ